MPARRIYRISGGCLLAILLLPSLASAHAEHDANGFIAGLTHPILGLDHLLAMLGVGVVSARLGGRYIWILPGIFVAFMIGGGVLGTLGIPLSFGETGIAVSVVAIGLLIATVRRPNAALLAVVMLFVGFFGTLHGHAHGLEMPGSASPVYYSFGFGTSTCTIHLLGVYLGQLPEKLGRLDKLPSYIGRGITLAGCYILYIQFTA